MGTNFFLYLFLVGEPSPKKGEKGYLAGGPSMVCLSEQPSLLAFLFLDFGQSLLNAENPRPIPGS